MQLRLCRVRCIRPDAGDTLLFRDRIGVDWLGVVTTGHQHWLHQLPVLRKSWCVVCMWPSVVDHDPEHGTNWT